RKLALLRDGCQVCGVRLLGHLVALERVLAAHRLGLCPLPSLALGVRLRGAVEVLAKLCDAGPAVEDGEVEVVEWHQAPATVAPAFAIPPRAPMMSLIFCASTPSAASSA